MNAKSLIPAAVALSFVLAGCGEDSPMAPPDPTTDGGGSGPTPPPAEPAVGALYPNVGDGRVVVINREGSRFVYYNPSDGSFSPARSVSELENGNPLSAIGAVAHNSSSTPTETYLVSNDGLRVASYDRTNATFLPTEDFSEYFDDPPFPKVGAAFVSGSTVFFFDEGGTRYTAWDSASDTWSPVYSFSSDFGGGGTPISAVGAAYFDGSGYVLFDFSGKRYTIYSGGGTFSAAFELKDFGDGTLSF